MTDTCTTPPRPLDWRPAKIDNPCQKINHYRYSPEPCAAPPWKERTLAVMNGECKYNFRGGWLQPMCTVTLPRR